MADETPPSDTVADMNVAAIERANLSPETLLLVRLAAQVAVDAPPASLR